MADEKEHPFDLLPFDSIDLPEKPLSFSFDGGEGYEVAFTDFASGGVKITLYRPDAPVWDKHAAAMLPSPTVDAFLRWMSNRAGAVGTVLPDELLPILKGLIALTKGSKRLPRADRKIIKQAIAAWDNLINEPTIEQRAFNR